MFYVSALTSKLLPTSKVLTALFLTEFWRRKGHIPNIMYFTAIAKPKEDMKFDGRVCFKPLITQVNAKRSSVKRKQEQFVLSNWIDEPKEV